MFPSCGRTPCHVLWNVRSEFAELECPTGSDFQILPSRKLIHDSDRSQLVNFFRHVYVMEHCRGHQTKEVVTWHERSTRISVC